MNQSEKLDFIKRLGKPRAPGRIKMELTAIIERGSVNNNNFSEDMKLGIFYGLLWQFGYDYDEAKRLARELLK